MKKVILGLVLVLTTVLTAGSAFAGTDAYAVSWDNIFNGIVTATNIGTGTIVATVASDSTAGTSTLNGTAGTAGIAGAVSSAVGTGLPIGPVIMQNGTPLPVTTSAGDMTQVGTALPNYAVGQAQIVAVQLQNGPVPSDGSSIQSVNKGEANVSAPPTNFATAGGANSSASNVVVTVQVSGDGGKIEFTGNAAPYMEASLTGTGPFSVGSQANAQLSASLTISHIDPITGQTINDFVWAPNGQVTADGVTGVVGGTELADPFSLNTGITALPFTPGPFIYDPLGINGTHNGLIGDLTAPAGAFNFFDVITNTLPAGLYTLTLVQTENVAVTAASVPEPGTIVLVGAGLIGLAAIARRKQS